MHHPGLVGEVVRASQPLVVQLLGRAIGRRCHRAAPVRAADHLHREMVDRQRPTGSRRPIRQPATPDVAKQRISAHSRKWLRFHSATQ